MLMRSLGATDWSFVLMRHLRLLWSSRSRPDLVRRRRIETAEALIWARQLGAAGARILGEGTRGGEVSLEALDGKGRLPLVEPVKLGLGVQRLERSLGHGVEPG